MIVLGKQEPMGRMGWAVWWALGSFQLVCNLWLHDVRSGGLQAFLWFSMAACYFRPLLGNPRSTTKRGGNGSR